MDILFLGTADFAIPTLEMLLNSDWRLVGVVTQPDRRRGRGRKLAAPPVKQWAADKGIPVFQPGTSRELTALVTGGEVKADVYVVAAFGQLLSEPVLEAPPLGCINLHPSLLPAYRGAAPLQRVIINGEKRTGITTMYLCKEMDAGDIILQEEVELDPELTYGELADLAATRGASLMGQTLALIERGEAPRLPQDHRRATYAPPLKTEEERIDWNSTAQAIHDLIRGMNPRPGAYTWCRGKILKIWRSRFQKGSQPGFRPGQVVAADPKTGLTVQTGAGQLVISEVQPAGRARMSGAEFVRGYRVSRGLRLGE